MRFVGVVLIGLLLMPAAALAQYEANYNQDHDPYVASLGLSLGYTSGTGLAFRWPVLPQVMGSVAGGIWGKSDALAYNVGVEFHYVLRQVGSTRVFVGPAGALYSDAEDDEADLNLSFGIGLEYLFQARAALKADLGFTYLGDNENVYPLPQVAVFYYF